MAHRQAIARAALAASLLRPDPISTPQSEIKDFHQRLDAVLVRCTRENIQVCPPPDSPQPLP